MAICLQSKSISRLYFLLQVSIFFDNYIILKHLMLCHNLVLQLFHLSILSVVAIELTVTMFLTPYWLQTMYGIPFFASQFVRILKSCVMIPLGIIIVYTMNRMIQKVIK